jgi:hypothetical protein
MAKAPPFQFGKKKAPPFGGGKGKAPPFGTKNAPSVETPAPPAFKRGGSVKRGK